jgi:membrane protein YdbS with pleckstrin-like domain
MTPAAGLFLAGMILGNRIVLWFRLSPTGTLERMRRLMGLLVVIWLAIGAVAVGQRGYFGSSPQNCAGVATVTVTVVAGPLNYLGVNPKVKCRFPQPSS